MPAPVIMTFGVDAAGATAGLGGLAGSLGGVAQAGNLVTSVLSGLSLGLVPLRAAVDITRTLIAGLAVSMQFLGGVIRLTLIPVSIGLALAWKGLKLSIELLTGILKAGLVIALTAVKVSIIALITSVTALTGSIALAVAAASTLRTGISNVLTLLGREVVSKFKEFAEVVRSVSFRTGESVRDLTLALFDIVSAGVPAGKALDVMSEAAITAVAGLSDVATTTKAGLTILNAYEDEVRNVADAFDFLFEAQRTGRTTVAELAEHIQRVVPVARQAGLSLNELGATISTVTRFIPNISEAITGIVALITELAREEGEQAKAAKELNVETGISALLNKGWLRVLKDVINLSAVDQQRIVRTVEGQRGLNALVLGYIGLLKDMEGQVERTGRRQDAFQLRMKDLDNAFRALRASVVAFATKVGEPFLKPLAELLTRIQSFFSLEINPKTGFFGFFGAIADEFESRSGQIERSIGRFTSLFSEPGLAENAGRTVAALTVNIIDRISKSLEKMKPVIEFITDRVPDAFKLLERVLDGIITRIESLALSVKTTALGGTESQRAAADIMTGVPSQVTLGTVVSNLMMGFFKFAIIPMIDVLSAIKDMIGSTVESALLRVIGLFELLLKILEPVARQVFEVVIPLSRDIAKTLVGIGEVLRRLVSWLEGKGAISGPQKAQMTPGIEDISNVVGIIQLFRRVFSKLNMNPSEVQRLSDISVFETLGDVSLERRGLVAEARNKSLRGGVLQEQEIFTGPGGSFQMSSPQSIDKKIAQLSELQFVLIKNFGQISRKFSEELEESTRFVRSFDIEEVNIISDIFRSARSVLEVLKEEGPKFIKKGIDKEALEQGLQGLLNRLQVVIDGIGSLEKSVKDITVTIHGDIEEFVQQGFEGLQDSINDMARIAEAKFQQTILRPLTSALTKQFGAITEETEKLLKKPRLENLDEFVDSIKRLVKFRDELSGALLDVGGGAGDANSLRIFKELSSQLDKVNAKLLEFSVALGELIPKMFEEITKGLKQIVSGLGTFGLKAGQTGFGRFFRGVSGASEVLGGVRSIGNTIGDFFSAIEADRLIRSGMSPAQAQTQIASRGGGGGGAGGILQNVAGSIFGRIATTGLSSIFSSGSAAASLAAGGGFGAAATGTTGAAAGAASAGLFNPATIIPAAIMLAGGIALSMFGGDKKKKELERQQKRLQEGLEKLADVTQRAASGLETLASGNRLAAGASTQVALTFFQFSQLMDTFSEVTRRRLRLFQPTTGFADALFTFLSTSLGGGGFGQNITRGRFPLGAFQNFFGSRGEIQVGGGQGVFTATGGFGGEPFTFPFPTQVGSEGHAEPGSLFLTRVAEAIGRGALPNVSIEGAAGMFATRESPTTPIPLTGQTLNFLNLSRGDIGLPTETAVTSGTIVLTTLKEAARIFSTFASVVDLDRVREANQQVSDFFDSLEDAVRQFREFGAQVFEAFGANVQKAFDFFLERRFPELLAGIKMETFKRTFANLHDSIASIINATTGEEMSIDQIKRIAREFGTLTDALTQFAETGDQIISTIESRINAARSARQALEFQRIDTAGQFARNLQVIRFTGLPVPQFQQAFVASMQERILQARESLESGGLVGQGRMLQAQRLTDLVNELFNFAKDIPDIVGEPGSAKFTEFRNLAFEQINFAGSELDSALNEQIQLQMQAENIQRDMLENLFGVREIEQARQKIDEELNAGMTALVGLTGPMTKALIDFFDISGVDTFADINSNIVQLLQRFQVQDETMRLLGDPTSGASQLVLRANQFRELTNQLEQLTTSGLTAELSSNTVSLEQTSVDLALPPSFMDFPSNLQVRLDEVMERMPRELPVTGIPSSIPVIGAPALIPVGPAPFPIPIPVASIPGVQQVQEKPTFTQPPPQQFLEDVITSIPSVNITPGSTALVNITRAVSSGLVSTSTGLALLQVLNSGSPGAAEHVNSFLAQRTSFVGLQSGGIVTNPMVAVLAERHKPEVVIPLDKLDSFMGSGGTSQRIEILQQRNIPIKLVVQIGTREIVTEKFISDISELLLERSREGRFVVNEAGVERSPGRV